MVNFNKMYYSYIVRWQSDLVNTKESILPVCDKPYHTNKRIVQKGKEIGVLLKYALNVHVHFRICTVTSPCTLWRWSDVSHVFQDMYSDQPLHFVKVVKMCLMKEEELIRATDSVSNQAICCLFLLLY